MRTLVRSLHWPRLFAAVFTAAVVLGVAVATGPLFLSSAANALLRDELELIGSDDAGLTARMFGFNDHQLFDATQRELYREITPIRELGEPIATAMGASVGVTRPRGGEEVRMRLFYRSGALENVKQISGNPTADGVWINDTTAGSLNLDVGDDIVLVYGDGRTRSTVAGIYRSLATAPLTAYWRPLMFKIANPRSNDLAPPPFLIADEDTFFELGEAMSGEAEYVWHFPLQGRAMSYERARTLEARYDRAHHAADDPLSPLGQAIRPLQRFAFEELTIDSLFFSMMDRIRATLTSLDASVRIVALGGQGAALFAIGGAGIFLARRRRNEIRLLLAQGVSPTGIGSRFAAETILPVFLGIAAGAALSQVLVRSVGPSSTLDPAAMRDALRGVAVVAGLAVALLGLVMASSARKEIEIGFPRIRRSLGRTPWEVVLLALAVAAYYEIARGRSAVVAQDEGPGVDVFVLAFPLLLIAGLAGIGIRLLKRVLPLMRKVGGSLPVPLYLAWRRLAEASPVALMLVASTAAATGVLVYAATLVDSIDATVNAKAHVATGSDIAVNVTSETDTPDAPFPVTRVMRVSADLMPENVDLDVLGIDPRTFTTTAFWDDSFSNRSLQDLIAALQIEGDRLPILVSGVAASGRISIVTAETEVPVEVIATPIAFPGMTINQPVAVVDWKAFEATFAAAGAGRLIDVFATPEIWGKGDPGRVRSFFEEQGLIIGAVRDSRAFLATEDLRSVGWTFSLMKALGILAAVIVLVGLLFYLETRQREREASYGLARRMGLGRAAHRGALAFELIGMLAVGVILGETAALLAGKLVLAYADPLPAMPPPVLFRLPLGVTLGLLPVALLVAGLGAWRVQRAADRVQMAEVMRVAT
ncbi:MAG: hypothetical protein M3277_00415 [Actinomycetota bacterium]|nr:hypothetical protein [Actinomycetota bacterium]